MARLTSLHGRARTCALLAAATLIIPAQPARAAGPPQGAVDAGDVVVVVPTNRSEALDEGDTNTIFSLRLPAGAECPGDSANDDWRVQSFIVPSGTDLQTLAYGATRPRGDYMSGLYTTEGSPYVQVLTAQNPAPGQPGMILDPPPLSFAQFTPDLLPVGHYVIGMACSYFERGNRYWDAEIMLTEAPGVKPGERRWQVVAAESDPDAIASNGDSGGDGGQWMLVLAAAAVGVVAVVATGAVLRRRRPPRVLAKEHSR